MAKLRIKNFGLITDGFDSIDGFIEFKKYTIFIGDQGTGKSTVAKIFSVCSWLEKAFFRSDYDVDSFEVSDFEELCRNQLLETSFNKDTVRLLRRRYLQADEYLKGNGEFNLPLSGYKAFVNKSNGETFIKYEKKEKLVPLICASSGLQSIVPSSLVTDYLASLSTVNTLEKFVS